MTQINVYTFLESSQIKCPECFITVAQASSFALRFRGNAAKKK